jgi:hypothetical protein
MNAGTKAAHMSGINLFPLPKMRGVNTVDSGDRVATASPFDFGPRSTAFA